MNSVRGDPRTLFLRKDDLLETRSGPGPPPGRHRLPGVGHHLRLHQGAAHRLPPGGDSALPLRAGVGGALPLRAQAPAAPQREGAIAWNDPVLGIDWRLKPEDMTLSEKDKKHPLLAEVSELFDYGRDYYAE